MNDKYIYVEWLEYVITDFRSNLFELKGNNQMNQW